MTRPTSRITALAASVPKVMICATRSRPYFSPTYWITSPRRRMQKSMSMSGMLMRSGLRKRSKSRSYCERIDVGDAQRVGDHRAGRRAAARAHRDVVLAGVADEVPDHQEVAGEAHLVDHLDLVVEPRAVGLVGLADVPLARGGGAARSSRSSSPSRATFSK